MFKTNIKVLDFKKCNLVFDERLHGCLTTCYVAVTMLEKFSVVIFNSLDITTNSKSGY